MKKTKSPMRPSDIKHHNEKLILRSIYNAGFNGRSQSEVVTETNLKAPTVLRFFGELENDGYIKPLEQNKQKVTQKTKGRPAVQYVLNKSKFYTVAIEFWAEFLSIGVFDFQGSRIYERIQNITRQVSADFITNAIVELVKEALSVNDIAEKDVIGIGIGAPGKVDVENGTVLFYARIQDMKNYQLAEKIEARLSIPVKVHNNCSVLALAESRYGKAKESSSLFMFLLRSGVNGSFVDKGQLYTSSVHTTIETGHIPLSLEGPLCECGKVGCLEALIMQSISKLSDPTFTELEKRVLESDTGAMNELREIAGYLYTAMRVTNNIFKPSAYLFVASSAVIADAISLLVQEIDRQSSKSFDSDILNFYAAAYNPEQALRGASDLIFDDFFV